MRCDIGVMRCNIVALRCDSFLKCVVIRVIIEFDDSFTKQSLLTRYYRHVPLSSCFVYTFKF